MAEFNPAPKQVTVDTRLGAGFNSQTLKKQLNRAAILDIFDVEDQLIEGGA